jgi:transcription termination factor Rho
MARNNNRRNKNRRRKGNKNKPKQKGFVPKFHQNNSIGVAGRYGGILEVSQNGYGFVRKLDYEFSLTPQDPFLTPNEMKHYDLRAGLIIEGEFEEDKQGNRHVYSIESINGRNVEEWEKVTRFELQTPIMPIEQITLGHNPDDIEMRVMDLVAPIGKGQRSLIVAPPRTGKTVLLKKIATSIIEHYPDITTCVLLVDERPEEVTDFMRSTNAEVFASSNDKKTESHVRISELALGYAKRKAEMGEDAVLLIDSITRLGRAYNAAQSNSGRTLSGGLDIRALEIPKRIFGSARKIEGGGSLTIIATCLIETNSRMDDLIFEEFKGTGNMELVLDRDLANDRIYPAINIAASGTRNEHKFITDSLEERNLVRRYLLKKSPKESMLGLLKVLGNTESNQELLNQIAASV